MVWAMVLAAPRVLEPFSIAGKVSSGSLLDQVALCYRDTVVLAPSQGVAGESQVYRNQLLQLNCSVL